MEGVTPDQLKSQVPSPDQIFIGGEESTPDQLKSQVPSPAQIFILLEGGGGTPDQHSWNTWVGATQEILNQKFW